MFHGHLDYFQKPPLGGRPNTKPGDHGTPNTHNRLFVLLYHVWEPSWIDIHWNSIWLRDRSHMTSHYTWGSMTTLHDFGGVLGRPLDTSFGLPQSHGHGSCEKWPSTQKLWQFSSDMRRLCGNIFIYLKSKSKHRALYGWWLTRK